MVVDVGVGVLAIPVVVMTVAVGMLTVVVVQVVDMRERRTAVMRGIVAS